MSKRERLQTLNFKLRENKCIWTTALQANTELFETFQNVAADKDITVQCNCTDCWDDEKKYPKEFEYKESSETYQRSWAVAKEYLREQTMSKSNHDDFEQNEIILGNFFKKHFFTLWRNLSKDAGVFGAFLFKHDLE